MMVDDNFDNPLEPEHVNNSFENNDVIAEAQELFYYIRNIIYFALNNLS